MRYPTVTLWIRRRVDGGADRLGNPVEAWSDPARVPGCLLAAGTPRDIGDDRPEGTVASATAYFPESVGGSLKGALVSPDGEEWLRVVGDPAKEPAGVSRLPWDRWALLERVDG